MSLEITRAEHASPEEIRVLSDGLAEYSRAKVGAVEFTHVTYFLRDEAGAIVGGVHGNYSGLGWLYVSTLWVSERVRGGGYGARLMELVEQEAAAHGCTNAYLDTFTFQAPGFYRKLGYTIFGELDDFPPGHKRCFLKKTLTRPDD